MAEQCNENSVATSSFAANLKWWPDVHTSSLGSWTGGDHNYASNPPCTTPQDPNSAGEEDVSISTSFTTNASNNSGLSIESCRGLIVEKTSTNNDPHGEAVSDNHHLWNQVYLGVATTGELHQNISTRMFEPACDYLTKMDNGWEFSSPTTNLSQQFHQKNFNEGLYQSKNQASETSTQFDHPYSNQFMTTAIKNEEQTESDIERLGLFRRGLSSHATEYQTEINNMVVADHNKYYNYNGMPDLQCSKARGFVDLVAFGNCLNKLPSGTTNCMSNTPMINTVNLPDQRKPNIHSSYQPVRARDSTLTKINGRGNGVANEGKRKKSDDHSGPLVKKPKVDQTSTVSSTKVQLPKPKLGDKITALQQIVSPFGKTDTASVLWEAIGYIKCLQEQVQLLSNPYMKTNIMKDSWVLFEAKDRGDTKIDLRSRGLCLVPTSCTPQVYHENNGSDYWTPTYRGCFYR